MDRFCENCGMENEKGVTFCSYCGEEMKHEKFISIEEEQKLHPPKPSRGKAIAGFICSLCGFLTCGISSIVGLVLSILGLIDSRKRGETDGLAIAGIVFSSLFFLLIFSLFVIGLLIPDEVVVPDFSTLSREEVQRWCNTREANCHFSEEYSDTIPAGEYISQSIAKGTTIKTTSSISIIYSKGSNRQQP